ncbi:MAG: VOC family protein [Proteobacteria bacterium]|nr:VOC family protein [Pseudomonadota bacterium]
MQGEITGFDHPIIGVRDLVAAHATFARLGFALTPKGAHRGWGTANHCAMFPTDYIEILGLVDPTLFSNNLDTFLDQRGEGLLKLALATPDAEACYRRLREAGVPVDAPKALSREIDDPEGTVEIRVKVIQVPPEAAPGVPSVIVEHLTPERLRRPEWVVHPNGAIGISAVTAVVEQPEAARDAFEAIFGAGSTVTTDRTLTVHTHHGVIFLSPPDDFLVLHPEVVFDPPPPPALVALEIEVADAAKCAAWFNANGVEVMGCVDAGLCIPPRHAHGVLLEFSAKS